ncbi:hypothetical protein CABS03_06140 [Colletotrichum abscissum]|uniref:Uncharacterized protein n=1 Tax=Colletotrichum abscissum TaxID=1671311 RepID=A0A9P9XBF9_9PEZI|nr:hypothetical protein CABS02_08945 [Colletotrichum abscissum]
MDRCSGQRTHSRACYARRKTPATRELRSKSTRYEQLLMGPDRCSQCHHRFISRRKLWSCICSNDREQHDSLASAYSIRSHGRHWCRYS